MTRLADLFGARDVSTFLGVPACSDLRRLDASITILGADCATPYPQAGAYCTGGARAIRAASSDFAVNRGHVNFDLGGVGWPEGVVVDAGDLPQKEDDPSGNRSRIFGAVSQILERRSVPVLIGGDDSVSIPFLEAFGARGHYSVLQIDAHIDWREQVAGERLGLSSVMRRASEMDHVGRIVQVGQRGIGSARVADMDAAIAAGVVLVPAGEVAQQGVGRAVADLEPGKDVILCLDLDALDPSIMPAVIARTAGGLSYWQVLELVAGAVSSSRVAGVVITEFMRERDIDGLGASTAAQLITSMLGLLYRQRQAA